ncbi:hypothetical protein PC9H_000320 [Pleurotus ostreatus]|uniref:non-specific serine/threonine protein kinase n=1 Tax=Pleurotus ostreatus TaxID=5322 RepID=A0A8H7A1P2_PLEOS|nr:uncharacterized protein PC9H_000320 [Pleurotus ostreatus]KAF7439983.1 hypothetical protein PC9H_000320 [Pleurotus ostreatus]
MEFLDCDDYLLQSCFYPNPELCQLLAEKMEEIQRLALGSFADIAYEQKMKSFADEAPAQMMKQHKSPFDSRANVPVARSGKAQLRLRLGDSDDSSTGSSTVGYCEPLPSLAPILYPTQNSKPFNHPGCFMYYHTIASTTSSETIIARETLSPQDGRVVCMKVFRKKYLLERNLVAYPIRELLAYKQLAYAPKHDGDAFVMKLEGCMQDKNRLFFAMQLMQCDLSNVLRGEAPHRPIQAQRWIAQISTGITAIHAAGLIHRDIKPANILLDTRDNVKITDFGSSYIDANGHPVNPNTSYSHHVAGTRGYMAPEMIYCQGPPQKYGLQVDYWSLGCVAFQLEMGSPKSPFPTCKDLDRYLAWDSDLLAGRSYFSYAGMDDDAGTVIAGLLHPDPSHRYNVTDLLNQPYFHNIQGISYFVDIENKVLTTWFIPARARPSIPLHHDFDEYYHEALVPPELFQPQWESTDQGQRSGQYPFEYFGWVHPQGLWSHARSPFHTNG